MTHSPESHDAALFDRNNRGPCLPGALAIAINYLTTGELVTGHDITPFFGILPHSPINIPMVLDTFYKQTGRRIYYEYQHSFILGETLATLLKNGNIPMLTVDPYRWWMHNAGTIFPANDPFPTTLQKIRKTFLGENGPVHTILVTGTFPYKGKNLFNLQDPYEPTPIAFSDASIKDMMPRTGIFPMPFFVESFHGIDI